MKRPKDELVRIIVHDQLPDGSFESLSVAAGHSFGSGGLRYRTTLTTAVILGAIADIADPKLEPVRQRAADFLIGQAGPDWSFNYWARDELEVKKRPYPDDWDDTSLALSAIGRVRRSILSGSVLARVVTMLTNSETREGGPYRTWMVDSADSEDWQDVDLAVNSNIAYFLKLQGVELPNLVEFASQRIATDNLESPYYPSCVPVIYFMSRWYGGELRSRLLKRLMEGRGSDDEWHNPLETALAITAGLNLGAPPHVFGEAMRRLMYQPMATLAHAYPFCFDPAVNGKQYVAGSGALTAALILETFSTYEAANSPRPVAKLATDDARETLIHDQVILEVSRAINQSPLLSSAWQQMSRRVVANDPARQITLLPLMFRDALGDAGRTVTDERLVELGAASLFGWLAYTVYDDFLDNEGKPLLLPLANVSMREMILAYSSGPGINSMRVMMNRMESANAWEVAKTRFGAQRELLRLQAPDFEDLSTLADRSMGHALGCIVILVDLGYGADSPECLTVMDFFRHFLIARQLSDDAHDWKADLRHGQVNSVAAMLLDEVPRRGTSINDCYTRLQQRFSEHTITHVCDLIDRELASARAALNEAKILDRPGFLEPVLAPVEASAREARIKQAETLEFLDSYMPPKQGTSLPTKSNTNSG